MDARFVIAAVAALISLVTVWLLWPRRGPVSALTPLAKKTLVEEVEFYRKLDPPERARFEAEVARFLADHTITGPRGAPLGDDLRALVGASAVMLVFGRPGFVYANVRDVVVYDEAFDEDYQEGRGHPILGMVHAQGPILFSERALREGFRNAKDGQNVGVHEFAHVLDFDASGADGVPTGMPWRTVTPWLHLMADETDRVEAHRSVLRGYAATNHAEFFAVATEAFFERPNALREKHPELYRMLVAIYGQDPAAARK